MDPAICSCNHSAKCRAHLRMQMYRQRCLGPPRKGYIKPLSDENGHFLNPAHRCQFPWSNYLHSQWYSPSCCCRAPANPCGLKHFPPSTKNLPRFFKATEQRADDLLYCDTRGKAHWESGNEVKVHVTDNLICQEVKPLKEMQLPVICVLGHAHHPGASTRHQFCRELARNLNFLYLNMDSQVRLWTDQLFAKATTEEVLIMPPAVKRLATMCVQLMADEELHLNVPGLLELIKLVMLNNWETARKKGEQPKGFIIEDFPCTQKEADAFEKTMYPIALTLYFEGRWWSDEEQKLYLEPEVITPEYFRRDSEYDEREVERTANAWGDRSIKILNMEDLHEPEAAHIMKVVKEKLANSTKILGTVNREDDRYDDLYAQEALQQLAKLYSCQDPCCGCAWNEATNGQAGGGTGTTMGGGGGPLVITCPLEWPQTQKHSHHKIESPKDSDKSTPSSPEETVGKFSDAAGGETEVDKTEPESETPIESTDSTSPTSPTTTTTTSYDIKVERKSKRSTHHHHHHHTGENEDASPTSSKSKPGSKYQDSSSPEDSRSHGGSTSTSPSKRSKKSNKSHRESASTSPSKHSKRSKKSNRSHDDKSKSKSPPPPPTKSKRSSRVKSLTVMQALVATNHYSTPFQRDTKRGKSLPPTTEALRQNYKSARRSRGTQSREKDKFLRRSKGTQSRYNKKDKWNNNLPFSEFNGRVSVGLTTSVTRHFPRTVDTSSSTCDLPSIPSPPTKYSECAVQCSFGDLQ